MSRRTSPVPVSTARATRARCSPVVPRRRPRPLQDLYLGGQREEAAAAVPDELVDATSLIGTRAEVADRLAALRAAQVTTLIAKPVATDLAGRIRVIEQLRELTA